MITAANELFPPVVSGIMLAAVLSAIMSTADSQLLVAGSALTHALRLKDSPPKKIMRNSRIAVLLISATAVGAAIFGPQDIFSRVLFAWSIMGSAFGPPLIARVFNWSTKSSVNLLAILTGACVSVTAYSIPLTKGTWVERLLPFLLGLALCYLGRIQQPKQPST